MRVSRSQAIRFGVAASLGLVSGVATAVPAITSVLTSYSALGTPTGLTIAGSGFCTTATGSCATKPTLTLGGTALTVSASTAASVTATIAAAPPDGDYALVLTAGTTGSVSYHLTVESLDKGPTGATGATGATGPPGAAGPAGAAGAKGATGATGATGAVGAAGGAATITVGTVTNLPAGSTPTVTNAGTTSAAKLNFGLVQGPGFTFKKAWVSGTAYAVNDVVTYGGSSYVAVAAVPSGTTTLPNADTTHWTVMAQQGSSGISVSVGITTTLPAGSPALVSNSGTASAPILNFGIPAGVTGSQGSAGVAGAVGATGPQGIQGIPGVVGPQGPVGPTGATGTAGSAAFKGAWNSGSSYVTGDFVYVSPTPNPLIASCAYIATANSSSTQSPFFGANPTQASPNWLALDPSCYGTSATFGAASATTSGAISNFGSLGAGYTSTATVVVNNSGQVPLTFNGAPAVTNTSGGAFSVLSTTCGAILPVAGSCQDVVQFAPTTSATYTGSLAFNFSEVRVQPVVLLGSGTTTIASGGSGQLLSYYLAFSGAGTFTNPNPNFWNYDFGSVAVGTTATAVASINNNGEQSVLMYFSFPSNPGFQIIPANGNVRIDPGQSYPIIMQFSPTAVGNVCGCNGSVMIYDTTATGGNPYANNLVFGIGLNGVGAGVASGSVLPNILSYAFSAVPVGLSAYELITITNNTNSPLVPIVSINSSDNSFRLAGTTCLKSALASGSTCGITVQYSPVSSGASSGSVVIEFGGVTPTLTIPVTGTAP